MRLLLCGRANGSAALHARFSKKAYPIKRLGNADSSYKTLKNKVGKQTGIFRQSDNKRTAALRAGLQIQATSAALILLYSNARTSSALVSGLTLFIMWDIIPFSSIIKVVRTTPILVLP